MYTDSQRKGLEKRFQMQKYISKPDRKKLAERLGLKDSQVSSILFNKRTFSFLTNHLKCMVFVYTPKTITCHYDERRRIIKL